MTIGPATIQALIAAVAATIAWGIFKHFFPQHEWARILAFGVVLALVMLVGPLVRLP